jgi:hypothetical protein
LVFGSVSGIGCSESAGQITCNLGDLVNQASATVVIVATAKDAGTSPLKTPFSLETARIRPSAVCPLIGTLPSLWLDFRRIAISIEDTNRLISLVEQ